MKTMKLNDIKITSAFAATIPKEEKMNKYRENWDKWHRQDRYIVINHNGFLIDGYIQYLVLKENDINEAEIKHSEKCRKRWCRRNTKNWTPHYKDEKTTYVYGVHPNSNCTKQFMWRVPKSWTWFADNVHVGDTIFCSTKFGVSPVEVTKVETLDQCPVNNVIKKVYSKEIRRNGCVVE